MTNRQCQIALHKSPALKEEVLAPAALEFCEGAVADIQEADEQLAKQGERLTELRKKRDEEPGEG